MSRLTIAALALVAAVANGAPEPFCTYKLRIPDEFKQIVEDFDEGRLRVSNGPALANPVACNSNVQTLFQSSGPEGTCGDMLMFEEKLDACCGGIVDENSRTITAELDFASMTRPIESATFTMAVTEEEQDCCEDCSCWGDPHCRPFGSTQLSDIKSFVLCDTSVVTSGEGDEIECSSRLENTNAAKKRCLGTAAGYEVNQGQCMWKGDDPEYNVKQDGGPCSPIDPMPLLMFGMPFMNAPNQRRLEEGEQADGYEILGFVGERGVVEKVKVVIRTTQSNTQNVRELLLDVKGDCASIENLPKDLAGSNNAIKTLYSDDEFLVTRTLGAQTTVNSAGETKAILDLVWTFKEKSTLDTVKFNCRGATDLNNREDLSASFRQEVNELTPAQKMAANLPNDPGFLAESLYAPVGIDSQGVNRDSQSTRPPKQTIIDSQFIRSKIDRNTGGRRRLEQYGYGFCFTGVFEEYATLFNTPGEPHSPYERCPVNENLDFADREALRAIPECEQIMAENNCENFVDNSVGAGFEEQPFKRRFNNYRKNIDICAKVYCSQASLPPYMDVQQCYTSLIDFGAPYTMSQYTEDTEYVEVQQEDCEEEYCVEYATESGVETKCFGSPADTLSFTGTPTSVTFRHNDCAGICGTRPRVDFYAKFNTGCSEIDGYICHPEGEYDCYEKDTKDCYDKDTKDCYDKDTMKCYNADTVCQDVLADCPP